jgi:hypothetical protein
MHCSLDRSSIQLMFGISVTVHLIALQQTLVK